MFAEYDSVFGVYACIAYADFLCIDTYVFIGFNPGRKLFLTAAGKLGIYADAAAQTDFAAVYKGIIKAFRLNFYA